MTVSVFQRKIACPGADEAGKMGAGAERLAQITRKCTDICALGASNANMRLRKAHA